MVQSPSGGPAREPQVSRELTSLEGQIKRAAENAERLGSRLSNVLVNSPPTGKEALNAKDNESLVPLAGRIAVLCKDLTTINNQVEDILARAEN